MVSPSLNIDRRQVQSHRAAVIPVTEESPHQTGGKTTAGGRAGLGGEGGDALSQVGGGVQQQGVEEEIVKCLGHQLLSGTCGASKAREIVLLLAGQILSY